MKFSKPVLDRADGLSIEYHQLWQGIRTLSLIGLTDTASMMVEDMKLHCPSKVQNWIDTGLDAESRLKAKNIIDDESAIAYMDEIEPRLKEYLIHYRFMIQRHNEELERFTEDLRF